MMRRNAVQVLAGLGCVAGASYAAPVTWNFDLTTTGNNVTFNSATAADPTAPEYDARYTITRVDVRVRYLNINFGPFDVTNQLPPDQLTNSQTLFGPPPVDIFNGLIIAPLPPDPTSFAGQMHIWIDGTGFGHLTLTDVVLGTVQVPIPPFGTVTAQLTSIRVIGNIRIVPIYVGDFDRDGDVDLTDLATLLVRFGAPGGVLPNEGDTDFDGDVDLTDLASLLTNFGRS